MPFGASLLTALSWSPEIVPPTEAARLLGEGEWEALRQTAQTYADHTGTDVYRRETQAWVRLADWEFRWQREGLPMNWQRKSRWSSTSTEAIFGRPVCKHA